MKNTNPPYRSAFVVFGALVVLGQAAPPVMRDAATHEQLSLNLRKSEQLDPMKKLPPSQGKDPTRANQPKDILTDSDIISFRGLATLLPKRSIIQVPKNYAELIKMAAGSKIVSWADFYDANRGWITPIEVSREQAEGNEPMTEETQKFISKSRNLIVATYKGGPISVLPLKVPPPETTKAAPINNQNLKP